MGGYGSGRYGGRPVAEEALRIDIAWMLREGLAKPGQSITGTLRWTCRGEPSGNVSYACDMRDPDNGMLELRFKVTRQREGTSKDYVQRIRLSYTQPHFGGRRWWMHCPHTGERVGKLYVPSGGDIFASRKAWRIGYRSQRIAAHDRPFEGLFRLQRRLGCPEGWEMPIRRPKGMHHRTFERFEDEYWRLDQRCGLAIAGVMARLGKGRSFDM